MTSPSAADSWNTSAAGSPTTAEQAALTEALENVRLQEASL